MSKVSPAIKMFGFPGVIPVLGAIALGGLLPGMGLWDISVMSASANENQVIPYRISLAFYNEEDKTYSHWCSGSVISNTWIVTAGSCFDKRQWSDKNASLVVLAGDDQLGFALERSHYKINETIYNWWYFINQIGIAVNDIALVSVSKPFEFGATIQPIRLVHQDEGILKRTIVTVSGWGSVQQFSQPKNLDLSIISKYDCNILLHGQLTYTGQICAGYNKPPNEESCPIQSDPGSPLTVNSRLAGILSWGTSPCGSPDELSVYTEVGYFRDWIRNNTGV